MPPDTDPRRRDLMQIAVNGWGTAEILKQRADSYAKKLRVSSLIGFALPVVVGATVIALGADWQYLKQALVLVAVVSAIQALYNAYLIFRGYEREMQECLYSAAVNRDLATRAEQLAKQVQLESDQFDSLVQQIQGENANQERHDERKHFTAKERRIAGRHGLFHFQQKCGVCKCVPPSLDAKADKSKCKFCGDF